MAGYCFTGEAQSWHNRSLFLTRVHRRGGVPAIRVDFHPKWHMPCVKFFHQKWLSFIQLNAITNINLIMYEPLRDNAISKSPCMSVYVRASHQMRCKWESWRAAMRHKWLDSALNVSCVGCYPHDLTVSHILHKMRAQLCRQQCTSRAIAAASGTRHVHKQERATLSVSSSSARKCWRLARSSRVFVDMRHMSSVCAKTKSKIPNLMACAMSKLFNDGTSVIGNYSQFTVCVTLVNF